VEGRFKLLCEALTVLAVDADAQLHYLEEIGASAPVPVDELALNYDDIAAAADTMLDCGEISVEQRNSVVQLNKFLQAISGEENAHLWTPDARLASLEWEEVRGQAKASLALLRS
jgi:hypothetical protein